jgi:SAM-dependent methyltransferase
VTTNTIEAAAYEIPELWAASWFPEEDRARMRALAALVPAEAQTLLDAGCGNGLFLDELVRAGRFRRLVGADRSAAALRHVATPRCRLSIDALPFAAGAFDIISCNEVLEHLPVDVYPRALDELARVARRFLLVAVPYRQNLDASLCRCPRCRAQFNPDFHVRSFDEPVMAALFERRGFAPVTTVRLGERCLFVDQVWLSRWAERRVPEMPAYAICPVCRYHDAAALAREAERRERDASAPPAAVSRGPLRRLVNGLRPQVTHYHWIAALYERQPAAVQR